MTISAEVQALVGATVREQMGAASIDSVIVDEDTDRDGDPAVQVTVVFDEDKGRVDPHQMTGLIRHIWPKLIEHNQPGFPLIRFVSKREHDRLKREAA